MSNKRRVILPEEIINMLAYDVPKEFSELNYSKKPYYKNQTIRDYLNLTFTPFGWDFDIIEDKIIESTRNTNKEGKEFPSGEYLVVKGRMTVRILDENYNVLCSSTKEQYGSEILRNGITEQVNAYKGACSDCLRKCAMLFGIGANINRNEKQNEFYMENMLVTETEEEALEEETEADKIFAIIDEWKNSEDVGIDIVTETLEQFNETLEEPIENINYKTICNDDDYIVLYYEFLTESGFIKK